MTFADTCMVAAIFLPYVWATVAKAKPDYNNAAPRPQMEKAEGWRRRANWAQMNAWEALTPFVAAVLLAELRGAPQDTVNLLSGAFVVFRVVHGLLYIADQATLRSLSWLAGFACVMGIFVVTARAG